MTMIYYIARSNKTNEPIGDVWKYSAQALSEFINNYSDAHGFCIVGMKEIDFNSIQSEIEEKKKSKIKKQKEEDKKRLEKYEKKHTGGNYVN